MHWVKATIKDESIRAERGALCHMIGDIEIMSPIPSVPQAVRAAVAEETFFRPTYTGTGTIFLESSLGGFHTFEIKDETWILESGSYWASEASVDLGVIREKMMTSYWAGEGLIDFQTRVSGRGKVVLTSQGPVDEITLNGETLVADGKYVIARSEGVKYGARRATKSIIGSYTSGEGGVRTYSGHGRVLVSATPYWRTRFLETLGK